MPCGTLSGDGAAPTVEAMDCIVRSGISVTSAQHDADAEIS
jgi:hypothetical protein